MIVITSKKFKASDWYNADGGTEFINGCVMDKTIATIEGYAIKTIPAMMVKFVADDSTIKNANDIDFRSFIKDGEFQVGEKIIFPDSASNNTELTITAVTDRMITVSDMLTDETCRQTDAFITSKITAIDFYYNLTNVSVNERKLFQKWNSELPDKFDVVSKMDNSVLQKYSILSDFDADNTLDVLQFVIGSEKNDWVTDTLEGDISEATITGMGIEDYKQKFKIVHTFLQTPLWTNNQVLNFKNRQVPANFLKNDCPTYIFGIEGKYDYFKQEPAVSFLDKTTIGRTAWYNQNIYKKLPDYSFYSIVYEDDETEETIDQLGLTKTNIVTIVVKSASGKFQEDSQFILGFCYCPLNEGTYQTASRTLRQNNINDRAILIVGDGAVNGDFYGTAMQVITNANVIVNNANTATITFTAKFSNTAKSILSGFSLTDLNYAFTVASQNIGVTSSSEIDRVNVLCDFQNMSYDQRNPDLLDLVDNIKCYVSPNITTPTNNISDFEGKHCVVEVPFQINIADEVPTLKSCGLQIVAVKANKEDFILESKTINTSPFTFTDDVQQINFFESKGYKLDANSPFNFVSLSPDATYDDDNVKGYLLHYAFILRNESWEKNDAIQPGLQYDILRDIPVITNRWADLISNGWTLKIRFVASVLDSKGNTTNYQAQTDLNIIKVDAVPGDGLQFTSETFFLDENNVKVNSIVKNGKTKIVSVFTPVDMIFELDDVEPTAAATTHYEFTLPKLFITAGTLSIESDEDFTDNGDGTLTGDATGTGTINYDTGEVVLDFFAAPTFPGQIQASFSYNGLGNYATPENFYGSFTIDKPTALGGPTKKLFISTNEDNSSLDQFHSVPVNESATLSWKTKDMTINVFGRVSVDIETIYTDESGTFGADVCDDNGNGGFGPFPVGPGSVYTGGTIGTIPGADSRQFEDLEAHLWDDGTPAHFE